MDGLEQDRHAAAGKSPQGIHIDLPPPPAELSFEPPLAAAKVRAFLFDDPPIDAQLYAVDGLSEQVVLAGPRGVRHVLPFDRLRALQIRAFPIPASHPLHAHAAPRLQAQIRFRDQRSQTLAVIASINDRNGLHLFRVEEGRGLRVFIPWRAIARVDVDTPAGLIDSAVVAEAPLPEPAPPAKPEPEPPADVQHTPAAQLAQRLGLPVADLAAVTLTRAVLDEVPASLAREHRVLPLGYAGERLRVAMSVPTDTETMQLLQFLTGRSLLVEVAPETELLRLIDQSYEFLDEDQDFAQLEASSESTNRASADRRELESLSAAKPVVRLVNNIILEAVRRNASDIHIRPGEKDVELIFRIDGDLVPVRRFARSLLPALVGRIKILGGMDITEHRLPQDGQARIRERDRATDLRLSVLPSIEGASVVIRLLKATVGLKDVGDIGLSPPDTVRFKDALDRSNGMILVTGPTGSGKSTTLYAALNAVIQQNVNIITVENPVEFHIPGITQIPINAEVGMTFAAALRNILRHDPDVIMVGEIRDSETAKIAVESALTGHLLLSTLHTNSAVSTIARMIEMGVESYLLRATLLGVLAQRLVKRNCPDCRVPDDVSAHIRELLGVGQTEVFTRGKGCGSCGGTGVRGRCMTYEYLVATPAVRQLIAPGVDDTVLQEQAIRDGMVPLTQHAIGLARAGTIPLDEAYKTRLE